MASARNVEREIAMVERYRAGETLQQIAADYSITRERVRQLLRRHGITRMDGGATLRAFASGRRRVASERTKWERRAKRWGGMTADELRAHVDQYGTSTNLKSPMSRYAMQRKNAHRRGIEWRFNFGDWWRVWLESGKWDQRGRGQGYCMARYGDSGPYSPDNVYICTVGQNFSDSYIVDHPRRKKARGYSIVAYPVVTGKRYLAKITRLRKAGVKSEFGGFATREAAESFAVGMAA